MRKIPTTLSLDPYVLQQVEDERGTFSRSSFVNEVLRRALPPITITITADESDLMEFTG